MALALYRKYRPRTFTEVIGQEHVTEPLMQALRSGRLHHAYLFSGPRGCGKTSSARILARCLNCIKGPTPEPCGECDSCVALALDGPGSLDVIEIDAASHGGVDDARELRERAVFAPVASRFKVYVIDEAHMVSPQGFNALLKLVEEPPDYVKFIFATTEPEKVLATIKSRTHHYPFRLIPPSVLRPYLEKLCREEGVSVEPAVLPLVVRAGGGSVRDSLSVLDQLIAGAGVYGVTYARAVSLLGVTDVALIDEMTDALAAGDGAAAFATVDRVADAGHDARRFAADLLERLRDLIVLQRVPDAIASGIIDAPDDQLERMAAQAARMGQATLSRLADIAHNGLTEMRGTTAPRLLLELIVARMLLPGADDSHGALLQRLERMERRLGAASEPSDAGSREAETVLVAAPVARAQPHSERTSPPAQSADLRTADPRTADPRPADPRTDTKAASATTSGAEPVPASVAESVPASVAETAPAPAAAPEVAPEVAPELAAAPSRPDKAVALDAAAVRRVWDEVLTIAGRKSRKLAAIARDGIVRDLDGNTVVLLFKSTFHAKFVQSNAEPLAEALYEVLGGPWQVRAELSGDQPALPDTLRVDTAPRPPAPTAHAPAPTTAPPTTAPPTTAPPTTAPLTTSTERAEGEATSGDGDWPTPAVLGRGAVPEPSQASEQRRGSAKRSAVKKPSGRADSARANRDRAVPAEATPLPEQGFDPGDGPLDDATTVRVSSEEQAIRTVQEIIGAERIETPNPRQ